MSFHYTFIILYISIKCPFKSNLSWLWQWILDGTNSFSKLVKHFLSRGIKCACLYFVLDWTKRKEMIRDPVNLRNFRVQTWVVHKRNVPSCWIAYSSLISGTSIFLVESVVFEENCKASWKKNHYLYTLEFQYLGHWYNIQITCQYTCLILFVRQS